MSAITSSYQQAKRDLDSLKNREEVVLANKSWVELKINKAFNEQQLRFACLTGDTLACEELSQPQE
jgi:hypothetical protein